MAADRIIAQRKKPGHPERTTGARLTEHECLQSLPLCEGRWVTHLAQRVAQVTSRRKASRARCNLVMGPLLPVLIVAGTGRTSEA